MEMDRGIKANTQSGAEVMDRDGMAPVTNVKKVARYWGGVNWEMFKRRPSS